ncbi:TonB-dependent receptor [Wenyingzhuangia sp. chi5]|uniref:TonB-dependent receptor n=1 Tax=Wenyingzhuangia gilva TaxID=3057677 RepID=A0ABT8VPX5_9FLAO|nr:TonB-dependent receptor [Wenyingzhuangia sp. chi5]MDO3694023.1 TonB-dependent receptor [Wenyingzhuangia sp. chi5]
MKKLLILFFLCSSVVFSQKNKSLKQVLNQLTNTYNITFSYDENQIQNFNKILFHSENDLNTILINLSLQTQLVFEKIDDENYIIRNKTKETKNICGIVYSDKTKEKLPFANIYFDDKTVLTNQQGKFEIKDVLNDDFITLKLIGYEPKSIPVNSFNTDCKKIFLNEKIHQLTEVIITDYLTTGFSKNEDGSVVLNPKKSGILPGVVEPDVLQSLQLIPGVQSPDETASGLHIRGSTPDQNLVVFDGMKMYHFSHYFGLISAFNPYITNNIKLYRSGTHAKYGNNIGGVLDISTDNKAPNKLSSGFGTTLTHADFFIKVPMFCKKVGLVFSARRSITDVVNTVTNQQYAKVAFQNSKIAEGLSQENLRITNANNDFFYEDYYSKIMVQPNLNNKFSFSYLYNHNNLSFNGENTRAQEEFKDDIEIINNGFHVNWELGTLKKGIHNLAFSKTAFEKNYEGFRIRTTGNANQQNIFFDKENTVNEVTGAYSFKKQTQKNNIWEFGYQFSKPDLIYHFKRDTQFQEDFIDDNINGNANNYAIFSEYQFHQNNKWKLNLGVRWQRFNGVDKDFLEPRFHLNYKTNNYLNVKFSAELKHQSLSQVQDFRNDGLGGLFNNFWALANNSDFPVLESVQTSLGADYQKNRWTIDLELYHKKIDGILFLFDQRIRAQKYFSGNNNVKGADFLIKKEWNQYNTWISYSLSKSIYHFGNLNNGAPFNGSFDVPHNFIWSHHYNIKKVELSLGWRFRSGIPYTVKTAELNNNNRLRIVFDDLNTNRLPNYTRLDFACRYKFFVRKNKNVKGNIGIAFQNILDKRNILSRDYEIQRIVTGQGSNRSEKEVLVEIDRIALGFVPNISFRVNF